tara:strand:- start:2895 stop:5141 length:2247 start_codon:yes stop_codon:yes gene_type:complete
MAIREQLIIEGVNKTQNAFGGVQRDLNKLNGRMGLVTKAGGALLAVFAARKVLDYANAIKEATSQLQLYKNQLRLITDGNIDLEITFNKLRDAAKANRTPLAETIDLFTKLRVTTQALGKSEEDVLKVTNNLSRALQIAGADGNTAASVIRQFGQAMASGEVRGDEFRSLVEGLGPALAIMAEETGITVGELRKMSRAGELTADVMFDMLKNTEILNEKFAALQPTIQQTEIAFTDSFKVMLAAIGEASGATSLYQSTLDRLISVMDGVSEALTESPFASFTAEQFAALKSVEELAAAVEFLTNAESHRSKELQAAIDVMRFMTGMTEEEALAQLKSQEATRDLVLEDEKRLRLLKDILPELELRLEITKELEEIDRKQKEATAALNAENQKLLNYYKDATKAGSEYLKMDFETPMEKAKNGATKALDTFNALQNLMRDLNTETEEGRKEYEKLEKMLEQTGKAYKKYWSDIFELEKKAREAQTQQYKKVYALEEALLNDATRKIEQEYKERLEALEDLHRDGFMTTQKFNRLEIALNKEKNDAITKANKAAMRERRIMELEASGRTREEAEQYADFENKSTTDRAKFVIEKGQEIVNALGQQNKKAFEAAKAYNIAKAIIDTYSAANTALKSFPPPFNFIAAAAVVAAGIANVAKIRGQTFEGREYGGSVRGNRSYVVGEAGPELFTPGVMGNITPNNQLGSTVNVEFTVNAIDAQSFNTALARQRDTIVGIVNEAVNDGGRRSITA